MARSLSRFLRDNAFIVAAVVLPVAVAAFFAVATVIPRWTVAPPSYDLVMRTTGPYDATPAGVMVEFAVRGGRVEATLRPGMDPGLPPAAGSLVRIVNRCAAMQIPGKAFTGVILELHRPGAPDWTREYGMDGIPVAPPKTPAPAPAEAAEEAK